ncbi:MAG: hypothetical protein K2F89_08720, partial [Treponemataceae bacterium]|nr:hypothetical protein [Treponemataceae bacterium]
MKFAKKILVALFVLVALCMAAAFAAFFYVKNETSALDEIQNEKIMRLKIERGTTAREVAAKLGQNGIIKNERVFYLLARFPNLAYLIFPN